MVVVSVVSVIVQIDELFRVEHFVQIAIELVEIRAHRCARLFIRFDLIRVRFELVVGLGHKQIAIVTHFGRYVRVAVICVLMFHVNVSRVIRFAFHASLFFLQLLQVDHWLLFTFRFVLCCCFV